MFYEGYDWCTGKRFDPWKNPPGRKVKFCPIDIINEKIEEAEKRKKEIYQRTQARRNNLDTLKTFITETEYKLSIEIEKYKEKEIEYINKWIRYWKWFLEKDKKEINIDGARDVPIEELYEGKLRKSGVSFVGCCPFHKEKTPSFHIYHRTNRYYCFGCNEGGDSIDFIMKLYGISFMEAVRRMI